MREIAHSDLICHYVQHNLPEAVKLAIQEGVSANTIISGCSPLHEAALNNNRLQCLKELLKCEGVDVNIKADYGQTPVSYCCQAGSDIILKTLIEHGADVNLSDRKKMTPLHHACRHRCFNVVKLLIEAGANVNTKDITGWTPLRTASSVNNIETCKYLLQHGAEVDIPYQNGLLPLHDAVVLIQNCELYNLIRCNTKTDTLLKYCTFPGPNGIDMVNRSILCLSVKNKCDKALIESVLKSGLPNDVLSCPVVDHLHSLIHYESKDEELQLQSLYKNLVLFTPLCFFLKFCFEFNKMDILNMLIDNKICVANKFKGSDSVYVTGCIEVILCTEYTLIDRFKLISMLLKNGIDADEECIDMPTKLLKLCIIKNVGKNACMLLLKTSNVVEPEDILRWIIDNWNKKFLLWCGILDLVYELLVLSPYVTMPPTVSRYFVTLAPFFFSENENMPQKIKQICEQPVQSLASYCRSVVRRQLHYETRSNHRQFTEKLNSLPVPEKVISYLKYNEIIFTVDEYTQNDDCQIKFNF